VPVNKNISYVVCQGCSRERLTVEECSTVAHLVGLSGECKVLVGEGEGENKSRSQCWASSFLYPRGSHRVLCLHSSNGNCDKIVFQP
jgi:hypothetical protein